VAVQPQVSKRPNAGIVDEAHDAPAQLENALGFELSAERGHAPPSEPTPPENQPYDGTFVNGAWAAWARAESQRVGGIGNPNCKPPGRQRESPPYSAPSNVWEEFGAVGRLTAQIYYGCGNGWMNERAWKFAPAPGPVCGKRIVSRGGGVLLTSGTITPKTLTPIGVGTPQHTDYQ